MLKELCSRRCSAYHLHLLIQPQVRRLQVQSGTVHHALHFSQVIGNTHPMIDISTHSFDVLAYSVLR